MSDSELSGFEEDGNYDEEGLSEIFSDISIESELDISFIVYRRVCYYYYYRTQTVFTDV